MALSLVILAAGLSSRYGRLKQLDPLGPNGEALLDYTLYDARAAGFDHVVFIVRPEIEGQMRAHFERLSHVVRVDYVHQRLDDVPLGVEINAQRVKPWGTGQAVLAVKPVVHQPFAVLNADDFYGRGAIEVLAHFLKGVGPHDALACLVGYVLRETLSVHGSVSRGVCETDAEGWVRHLVEMKQLRAEGAGIPGVSDSGVPRTFTGAEPVSMNCWGFTPRVLEGLQMRFEQFVREHGRALDREFILSGAIDEMVQTGQLRLRALPTTERWFGMTNPADRDVVAAELLALHRAGAYPQPLPHTAATGGSPE